MHVQALFRLFALATLLLLVTPAWSAMLYSLPSPAATAGSVITLQGVLINDTRDGLSWRPPRTLKLTWIDSQGSAVESVAELEQTTDRIDLPVNSFTKLGWTVPVPALTSGMVALVVEGSTSLLALQIESGAGLSGATDNKADSASFGSVHQARSAPNATTQRPLPDIPTGASSELLSRFQSAVSPYEPIYFDLGNKDGLNARFQVSLKYRLFTPSDPSQPSLIDSLYLGYTQTSLWDLDSDSLPFVDTSFKPSLFWRRDELWRSDSQFTYFGLASGVEHESNGKSGEDSRSLNFAYIQPELNYRLPGGSTVSFTPRLKTYFGMGNNRNYTDYAGYVDWKLRWAQDNGLVLTGLYRHGRNGRDTTQLEAAWPLKRTFLNMNGYLHVQYFEGYGQTLLGYDKKSGPQVRLGIALVP